MPVSSASSEPLSPDSTDPAARLGAFLGDALSAVVFLLLTYPLLLHTFAS